MPTIWPHDDRRWVMLEWWFVAACLALFAYNVLAWQGLVGDEPPWRPVQAVLLSGGMLLQPLAALARPRSVWLWGALLAASLAAIGFSVVAR